MYRFTEDCLIGIETIDEEHKKLFQLLNETEKMLSAGAPYKTTVTPLISELKEYAATHFAHEEAYMEQIHDPELPRQRKEHAEFTEKVNSYDLQELDDAKGKEVAEELLHYLARWLYRHILGSDIMIGKMETGKFAFTEEYKTGIDMVDEEHKRLFEIIEDTDKLIHAQLLHDKYDEIMRILGELKDYTVMHFQDEEMYMESIGYAGLEMQRMAHQAFIYKLNEINLDEMDDNQQEYLEELIQFLLGWLVNHILKMDKRIPKN